MNTNTIQFLAERIGFWPALAFIITLLASTACPGTFAEDAGDSVFDLEGENPENGEAPLAELQNEIYSVTIDSPNQIQLSKTDVGSVQLNMTFLVLYREDNPNATRASRSCEGVRYSLTHWSRPKGAAEDADDEHDGERVEENGEDFQDAGDGWDPRILERSTSGRTPNLFHAAPQVSLEAEEMIPNSDTNELTFHYPEHPYFNLQATLSLPEGDMPPVVQFDFTPRRDGYYSVGYMGAPASEIDEIDDMWQPLIWQEKRFPTTSYMTLAYRCPLPTTLVTRNGVSLGIVADPGEFPFDPLPLQSNSRFGVAVRNRDGLAQPMLFAPVLGIKESEMKAQEPYSFKLRPVIEKGDTTEAFEGIARSLYDFHDYRSNALCSLNTTLENMIDYGMSEWSRFSEEHKGCDYSTDAPGAIKNVSSLNPLEMAIVTDNEEIFQRRAYPYIEYMLSRGKFLFSPDRSQRIQYPSYTLSGPCAPISELTALYEIFDQRTGTFLELAEEEYQGRRARNLSFVEEGETWPNALAMYRATGAEEYLEFAKKRADEYIKNRIESPATDFDDPMGANMQFWTEHTPRFAQLLELYETTGEERYLNAAHRAARRYTQVTWMSPRIPDEDILVNEGGKAPHYWYLSDYPRMSAPEEEVPAWRLSAIGLTPESSGTSQGHRAIFMANPAPWLIRIGHLTEDNFLKEIGRSAIVGRYRNFPGYHINTARTTVYEKEDYPLRPHDELSVNSFHYNHIWPMMSQLLDYLVIEAEARSDGAIDFPTQYIEGYAYLQNKFYGHKEGTFYDADDAILWMPKQLLDIDNIEVNYISARGEDDLYLALMNEDNAPVKADITLDMQRFESAPGALRVVSETGHAEQGSSDGTFTVEIPARGLTSVVLEGAKAKPDFQTKLTGTTNGETWEKGLVEIEDPDGKAMILDLGEAAKTAYVFLEYSKNDFYHVTLNYDIGNGMKTMTDYEFPWEFTVPLEEETDSFSFRITGILRTEDVECPILTGAEARASSTLEDYTPEKAVDGEVSDRSRWLSARDQEGPSWLELTLGEEQKLPGIRLYSGYRDGSAISNLYVEYRQDGEWRKIPGSSVEGNEKNLLEVPFDKEVRADNLRLVFPHDTGEIVRVREVEIMLEEKEEHKRSSEKYNLRKEKL